MHGAGSDNVQLAHKVEKGLQKFMRVYLIQRI